MRLVFGTFDLELLHLNMISGNKVFVLLVSDHYQAADALHIGRVEILETEVVGDALDYFPVTIIWQQEI